MRWFHALSFREKILIAAALPLGIGFGGYQLLWVPLNTARAAAHAQIAEYRRLSETAVFVSQNPENLFSAPAQAAPKDPISTRVTQSVSQANLRLRRIETTPGGVRVTLEDAAFSHIILWLHDLELKNRISVSAIELDRRPEPGIVSARILLRDLS